ncbi:MAG: hypothetical protein K1X94_07000 [Sandaracinaceae bacterium]|nr:hypothetical protein [Sandaracinaceae bacterium]
MSNESRIDEVDAGALERRRLLRRWSLVVSAMLVASFGFVRHANAVGSFLRREIDLFGNPIYVPLHAVRAEDVARIDFDELHRTILPEYVVAIGHADTPAGHRRTEYAFRRLRDALAPDPNLVELWRELHLLAMIDPVHHARRIDYLLWAHNRRLEMLGQPYRIEATLYLQGERPRLATRSYQILEESESAEGHRARYLHRIDRLPFTEPWLGHTTREADGAMLVADRILHFATRHLWPALAPALEERRPETERGPIRGMREEAERAIDPALYAILLETSEDQQALLEAAASIEARQACGSRFRVFDLPYRGLSRRSYAMLALAIQQSRGSRCPDVTLAEAAQIVGASERLAETPRLEEALEALTAFAARAIAVHEVRHVADGPSRELRCPGCAPATPALVRAELSAYLASFADGEVGYTAALVACSNPERERGVDAHAIRMAVEASMPDGCGVFSPTLRERARGAEERYFGERAVAALEPGFPRPAEMLVRRRAVVPMDLSWLVEEVPASGEEPEVVSAPIAERVLDMEPEPLR